MKLSREDALGQLLVMGLGESRWSSSLERLLRACRPGGILLSAQSLRSPEGTAELLARVARALAIPPFLALEEEGGTVDPLRAFFPPLPSPRAAAGEGSVAVTRLGELVAAGLKLLGFNTNFAPLLDLSTDFSDALFGSRTFSSSPHRVARCGESFVRGLRRFKILACGKHFPGLGGAKVDSRSHLPRVGKPMAELWRKDLVPYRQLHSLLPLVLVSHAAYKAYDFDLPRPATLSANVLEGLLRVKLGYRGVAVTDNLDSEVIRRMLDPCEAAVRALNAGCDLLLVGYRGEFINVIFAALHKALEAGRLSNRRLEQALVRIRLAKKGLAPPGGRVSQCALDRLARQFENFSRRLKPQEQKIA